MSTLNVRVTSTTEASHPPHQVPKKVWTSIWRTGRKSCSSSSNSNNYNNYNNNNKQLQFY
eukprot:m.201940 g.201940  ORF g.201940 m.201940 type:complete len:60 (-) comp14976_c0_seq1:52-231(-)